DRLLDVSTDDESALAPPSADVAVITHRPVKWLEDAERLEIKVGHLSRIRPVVLHHGPDGERLVYARDLDRGGIADARDRRGAHQLQLGLGGGGGTGRPERQRGERGDEPEQTTVSSPKHATTGPPTTPVLIPASPLGQNPNAVQPPL